MADSGIDQAINAGLILVVTVFMAYIVNVVGDLFDFGGTDSNVQNLVDILRVIIMLIGLLASFLKLRDIANSGSSGMRPM